GGRYSRQPEQAEREQPKSRAPPEDQGGRYSGEEDYRHCRIRCRVVRIPWSPHASPHGPEEVGHSVRDCGVTGGPRSDRLGPEVVQKVAADSDCSKANSQSDLLEAVRSLLTPSEHAYDYQRDAN